MSFNPLDRGNLNQIQLEESLKAYEAAAFQSPRSGKFESNKDKPVIIVPDSISFQSPRSGKFESNNLHVNVENPSQNIVSIP